MAEGTVPGCIGRRGKGWLRADGVDRGVDDGGPVGLRIVRVTQKIAGLQDSCVGGWAACGSVLSLLVTKCLCF